MTQLYQKTLLILLDQTEKNFEWLKMGSTALTLSTASVQAALNKKFAIISVFWHGMAWLACTACKWQGCLFALFSVWDHTILHYTACEKQMFSCILVAQLRPWENS